MADDCRSSLAVQVWHRFAIAGGMSHGTYKVHYPVHGVTAAWQQPKKSTPSALAKLFGVTAPSCSVSWNFDGQAIHQIHILQDRCTIAE
jgi:hypothetical protein